MKSKKSTEIFAIAVCAAMIMSSIVLFSAPNASAAQIEWTEWSYNDFSDSPFGNNIELNGIAGGDGDFTLTSQLGWYDMNPNNDPGTREGFGFAFDSKNNVAVLFGGGIANSPYQLNDTWEYDYDTNTWTQIIADNMPGSPPRRKSIQMDYDSANEVIVLWGGYGESGDLADTWEYDVDAQTWTETTPISSPPVIGGYALAYDSLNSKILVAGTNEIPPGGVLHLWAYDAGLDTWNERASTPYPRAGHDMAFNGQKMIVQGGFWGMMMQTKYDDTLVYDYGANSWTVYTYGGEQPVRPGPRIGNAMARFYNGVYDVNGYDVIYKEDNFNFTVVASNGWADVTPPGLEPKPLGRDKHRMVWDSYHNALILYGGMDGLGRLNDTWVYTSGYAASGWYVSKWNGNFFYDSGSPLANWQTIWWNNTPANQPSGTKLKFQLQSGNSPDPGVPINQTAFVGPNNDPLGYYENPGDAITDEHKYHRWIRYKAFLDGIPSQTPVFDDITIHCSTEGPPFVSETDPAKDETGVDLDKNINITFSEPMNTGTVTWNINPNPTGWSQTWSPDDTILYLNHSNPFTENTKYMVTVTGGKDQDSGLDLVDPYDLNPWNFTTMAIGPWLVDTSPADDDFSVPWTKNITVNFSEPMDTGTVIWMFSSFPVSPPALTDEWGNGDTTLYLNHTDPLPECQIYTMAIIQGKDLAGNNLDPTKGVPNPWSFTTFCDQPYVTARDPEHNENNVPLDKNILITFSEEMDNNTVFWNVSSISWDDPSDPLGWTETWESGNTVLNISHTTPFTENTRYWVNVTDGKDLGGSPLNRDVDLAQWWFFTEAAAPWIVDTDPYDTETGVEPDRNIVVTFSEAIVPGSFSWTIIPDPGGWTSDWSPDGTILYLNHSGLFAENTEYTVNITNAQDSDGNPLDPSKGVPNPWWFMTGVAKPGNPRNLRVERSPPDIIIKWDSVSGATEYRVYESQDRFAPWPWSLLATVIPPTTQYSHPVYADGLNHFYIVRAFKGVESGNSTMGVKAHLPFSQPAIPKLTDINWLSLPYNSIYVKASDIANELTETNIRVVGKWDPARQRALTYAYANGKWIGPDFSISPGEGVFIAGLQTNFDWVVTGTDSAISLNFVYYPTLRWNFVWISIPYTGIYDSASSIVIDIEGSPFTPPTKITEVGRWDASTQTAEMYYWDGAQWTGTNFSIAPGDGIYIRIKASFNWPIKLLTPEVP